ncbi:MAG: yhdF [Bacteroidetes bacterium]|jgi:NAD(P)-dependent dehydrogenase (short-subunit alcohol dehydrogenase family)|nr:yhdF [Bacteroidota bacterium]
MQKTNPKKKVFNDQAQSRPGMEYKMNPEPEYDNDLPGSNKLLDKKCIVTGGDSGIGRAVAIAFAKEGADVAIMYFNEDKDAKLTAEIIREKYARECLLISADIGKEKQCISAIKKILKKFKRIDVLVNNAGLHYPKEKITQITTQQLERTFAVNIFSMFWLTKEVVKHMPRGSCIINTSSVTAYRGSAELLDYSATKGAIVSFTRSLSANLANDDIRVNGVAPGPIWTPLIPSSFPGAKVTTHGSDTPMKRAGQPVEVASCYVFLASDDSRYITGQFLHPNGGEIVNG